MNFGRADLGGGSGLAGTVYGGTAAPSGIPTPVGAQMSELPVPSEFSRSSESRRLIRPFTIVEVDGNQVKWMRSRSVRTAIGSVDLADSFVRIGPF